jgi:predicted Zn-dependent peptidase
VEDVKALSVKGFRRLVKDYFSNFNGSTLIVKGQFPTDSVMPLVLKYIGALPSKPQPVKRAVWSSDHFRTTDTIAVELITNATPYCMTMMFYTWEKGYHFSQETHAHNQVLQSVLRTLLLDKLRIEHSDVYTVNCSVDDKQLPLNRMACVISFACNPTQRERIAADVDRLVHEMAEGNLITQALIDSYVKEREKHVNDTNYGSRYYDLTRELGDIVIDANNVTFVKQVTPASLKAHLRQLLKKGNAHIGYLTTE